MRIIDTHDGPISEPLEDLHDARAERWYVVQTHQRSEGLAERHLLSQNFRTFLPKRRRTLRHARSMRTVCAAYFDCYLFVGLDIQRHRWSPINSTIGVRKLIMANHKPIPVPQGVVESLMQVTDEEGILHPKDILKYGQKIRVHDGPFAGQLATMDYVGRSGAVRILMDIMHRSVSMYIDRDRFSVIK
ncbi:transcription antiterminator NusG [Rhizobium sp. ARZ01]|uniref:transcription termination/antitermination NusG family protein n=1 Tax=Rhizobium sp. ARZ01 TaxID=2769313 RepID=UPI0017812A57|nr:transcription termination/antitermination NusG family protein [Rhizobium sp. ARZ01]MBD9373712.1 transcription antiterminator NusG [Rhizobium sp. ARZ01]